MYFTRRGPAVWGTGTIASWDVQRPLVCAFPSRQDIRCVEERSWIRGDLLTSYLQDVRLKNRPLDEFSINYSPRIQSSLHTTGACLRVQLPNRQNQECSSRSSTHLSRLCCLFAEYQAEYSALLLRMPGVSKIALKSTDKGAAIMAS